MTNTEYTEMVDRGEWPKEVIVPLDTPFVNSNGVIQNLVLKPMNSVAVIISVKDSIRANHYHKTDWHYSYVVSGSIEYYWRSVGDVNPPKHILVKAGQVFFTPPMTEHAMVFPEATTFITMARNIRTHENHEADVVRIKLV
jgi:quercetin dioxygenase-like cupin family protein